VAPSISRSRKGVEADLCGERYTVVTRGPGDDGGEIPARAVSSDRDARVIASEFVDVVGRRRQGARGVLDCGGPWMYGCEAVLDGCDGGGVP